MFEDILISGRESKSMDKYDVIIKWSDEDNCFTATIPRVSRMRAYGETRAEALQQMEILAISHPEIVRVRENSIRRRCN